MGNDAQLRERESANDTHHAHSKTTGSRLGTSIDQNLVFGVTTQFSQVHYVLKAAQGEVGYVNRLRDFLANLSAFSSFENVVTSTFQAIQNCFYKGHIKKFGTSAKLQLCKFIGVSYKRLSFNHNASIKNKN